MSCPIRCCETKTILGQPGPTGPTGRPGIRGMTGATGAVGATGSIPVFYAQADATGQTFGPNGSGPVTWTGLSQNQPPGAFALIGGGTDVQVLAHAGRYMVTLQLEWTFTEGVTGDASDMVKVTISNFGSVLFNANTPAYLGNHSVSAGNSQTLSFSAEVKAYLVLFR